MSFSSVVLEFICAQSPQNTKGLLIGLLWFIFGFFNGVGRLAFAYVESQYTTINNQYYNFELLMCVGLAASSGVLGMVMYVMVATIYKNRERPQPDEDDLNVRAFATSYYSKHSFSSHKRVL